VRDHGGAGPCALLLHGGAANLAGWDELAALLVKDFRVAAFDANGHGASETPPQLDVDLPLREVETTLRALGFERPLLIGSSLGGSVALRFAAAGRPLAGVAALDGAPWWRAGERVRPPADPASERARLEAAGYGAVRTSDEVERAIAAAVASRGAYSAAAVEAETRRTYQRRADGLFQRKPTLDHLMAMGALSDEAIAVAGIELFDRIACPVLLLHAERSVTSSYGRRSEEQRARLSALDAHANVEAVWLDAGHLIHYELPGEVAARIRAFARRSTCSISGGGAEPLVWICWWRRGESNSRHADFQSAALPTELPRPGTQLRPGAAPQRRVGPDRGRSIALAGRFDNGARGAQRSAAGSIRMEPITWSTSGRFSWAG
jgi:pimeloyl-ACP methyl ester carboxylesterase